MVGAERELPMFPLSTVLLPGESLPLHVFEPRYRAMVERCLESDRQFGIVLIERGIETGGGDQRCAVATAALIESIAAAPDGRYGLIVRGNERVTIRRWLEDDPYPRAIVSSSPTTSIPDLETEALSAVVASLRRVRALWSELGEGPPLPPGPLGLAESGEEPLWQLCSMTPLGPLDRQKLLETEGPAERLALLADLLHDLGADFEQLLSRGARLEDGDGDEGTDGDDGADGDD